MAGKRVVGGRSPLVKKIISRVERVFARLDAYSYLTNQDRRDFRDYLARYRECLVKIDEKIITGRLQPMDLRDFPQIVNFPSYGLEAALYIGSFDPFQMTHLAVALRCLASAESRVHAVFVVPEGSLDASKPGRGDYRYRFDILSRQLKGVFDPLIVPLDIGEGADTIEIVRRFIALFPGSSIEFTHLLGSDNAERALRFLPADIAAWTEEAGLRDVQLGIKLFIAERAGYPLRKDLIEAIEDLGVELILDRGVGMRPASTDFRNRAAYTIVFPTEAVIRHLEVLFRYKLQQNWQGCEQELEWYI
jgi:nicotinic acid mononucleotide adenylyltransferase